ncbi:hypothetical protein ACFW6V_28410 [Streptomyces sp. NPDC058734]|uniref:hypothetical protein n=1 Tax=Streptomyces sp. NPDC058734 TaxID=3346615 RepID=UPI003689F693
MADIELTDDLILCRKRADTAWARLRGVQDKYGRPSAGEGWSAEAHAEWEAARIRWAEAVDEVQEAIAAWAEESKQRRIDIEARLTGEVRGGKAPQVWPEAG